MKRRGIRGLRASWLSGALIGAWAVASGAFAQMQPVAMQPVALQPVALPAPTQLRAMIDGAAMNPVASAPGNPPRAGRRLVESRPGLDPQTCLTQAVYYEARSESRQGQEAVAQVVMNRTRLPQ